MTTPNSTGASADADEIFELLLIAAHRVAVEVCAELSFEHLSALGLVALRRILREGGWITPRALAAALGCSRVSATELVARLVRHRLVERAVDPNDRRMRRLKLTTEGTNILRNVEGAIGRCMRSVLRNFSAADKARFRTSLERLDRATDWHRTERLWKLHAIGGPGCPRRRPVPHVR